MCENWNNRHFHDCSPPVASPEIGVFRLLPLHSLSFQLFRKHCSLTIFNSFNFIAREFSVESFRMEIFRVFEGLAKDCISTPCKHIENRPEKDGVLTVEKRRFFSMELDSVFRKTVFRSKTSPKQDENSADLPVLHSCFVVRKIGILYFGFR